MSKSLINFKFQESDIMGLLKINEITNKIIKYDVSFIDFSREHYLHPTEPFQVFGSPVHSWGQSLW